MASPNQNLGGLLSFFRTMPRKTLIPLRRNSIQTKMRANSWDSAEKARMRIGPYIIIKQIGEGAHSKVKLAYHAITRKQVAIKIVNKKELENPEIQEKEIRREVTFLKSFVECDLIVHFEEFFETHDFLCLVLEYLDGGDLFSAVTAHTHLKEPDARKYFMQIAKAVQFIHSKGICHRDLKLENIMIDSKGNIKITDFGLSTVFKKDGVVHMINTFCGTPDYAAPEVLKKLPYDGPSSDVWSLGVILFASLSGCFPFQDEESRLNAALTFPFDITPEAKDLISRILVATPSMRLSIREILAHPWCLGKTLFEK